MTAGPGLARRRPRAAVLAALLVLVAGLTGGVVGGAGTAAPASAAVGYDWSAAANRLIAATDGCAEACGLSISVQRRGAAPGTFDNVWRQGFGDVWPGRVVWTASAGKMITGITVMTVVDDGLLSLDTTVGSVFPAYAGTPKGAIKLRQLLSHTSGIVDSLSCLTDPNTTLAACADQALALPLKYTPGTTFWYAGPPMQIAARMVEIRTGKPFVDVFRDNVATPLGLPTMHWGSSTNPRVDGGHNPVGLLASTFDEDRVIEMMLGRGVFRGTTVLSSSAFDQMIADQVAGTNHVAWPVKDAVGYGIGMWVQRKDGGGLTQAVSSPGIFGSTPWVDFARGYGAWMEAQGDWTKITAVRADLTPLIDAQIDAVAPGTAPPVPPKPVVTGLSANRGPIAGGQTVTVTGTGLRTVVDGWFSTQTRATSVKVVSDTRVDLVSPARPAGLVNVLLENTAGLSATGTFSWYSFVPPPTVTKVTPNQGPAAGGTVVTLTGTKFTGATAVRFSTTNATSFTVVSDTRIDVVTPARSSGIVNVFVVTPWGTSATSASTMFGYQP